MTLRWPLIGSLVALVMGAALAALVLAFCGESGGGSSVVGSPTRTPASRTTTVTRTPRVGTPAGTGTPSKTPTAPASEGETETPTSGVPPEETPKATPPPEDTATTGPAPTLPSGQTPSPGQTPALASPTQPAGTVTPASPTLTPQPTSTPSTVQPDLVVADSFVANDVLGVVLGNEGHATVPAGQKIEFLVRGVVAEAVTLPDTLVPGASTRIALEDQVLYRPELVLVVVDPSNLIPEEDDGNNGLAKQLAPDVALDLAVHGVFRSPETNRLLVVIQNPTSAPAVQVTVVVSVYVGSATPTTASTYQLTIEPLGFDTVDVVGVLAPPGPPGTHVRVVAAMTDPTDANPANNAWEGDVS